MSTAADNGVNDTTRKNLILNYCFIALSGLVLYEYIITISDEIQLFWDRRPTTWSFFLFTSNRLIMIGLVVTGALTVAPADRVTSCKAISLPYGILQLATYTLWAVVSTLRVYALSRHSRHSWYLSTATLGTGLVPLGINIFDLVKLTYSVLPGTNECQDIYNYSNALPPGLTIASRTSAMVSDIIVIVVTWYYTYNRYRNPLQLQDQPSLTLLMLRDGTLYFIIFLVMNILRIVLDHFNTIQVLQIFMIPISSILISRFLLNIRAVVHSMQEGSSTDLQDLSFIDASTRLHQQLELGDDESVTLAGTIELDDVVDRDQLDLKSGSVFGKSDSPVGTGDNV